MSEKVEATRAIIYVDGGFLPESEHKIGGRGVHGYTFSDDIPKKGTGNPKAVPTDNGYIGTDIVGNKVTIDKYIDQIAGGRGYGSNNEVELYALYDGLKWVERQDELKTVKFFSDSMFCVKGLGFVELWKSRNWLTPKGVPVKYRPLWEKVSDLFGLLKGKLESITLEWIPRDASIGNVVADSLATRGIVLGTNDNDDVILTVSEAQGYWGIKNGAPRLLQAPRWYFATNDFDYKRPDGSIEYYLGAHGTKDKEDELFGKRYADNFLGVVRVKEPDPVMEQLRLNAMSKDPKKYGAIVIAHLDAIFSPKTYKELSEYGPTFLYSDKNRIDLLDAKKTELLVELKPVGLGYRGASQWAEMAAALDGIAAGDTHYRMTDITDIIYETQEVKKKTLRKLRPAISQITKWLDVKVEFNLEKQKDEPKPFEGKVRLILGGDILTRNQLSALSEEVKSVKVVTWRDSDLVGRYATMVELVTGDVGLWARTEANIYYAVKR